MRGINPNLECHSTFSYPVAGIVISDSKYTRYRLKNLLFRQNIDVVLGVVRRIAALYEKVKLY
jgi:hypothetical protein